MCYPAIRVVNLTFGRGHRLTLLGLSLSCSRDLVTTLYFGYWMTSLLRLVMLCQNDMYYARLQRLLIDCSLAVIIKKHFWSVCKIMFHIVFKRQFKYKCKFLLPTKQLLGTQIKIAGKSQLFFKIYVLSQTITLIFKSKGKKQSPNFDILQTKITYNPKTNITLHSDKNSQSLFSKYITESHQCSERLVTAA